MLHQPFLRGLAQLWSRLSPHTESESRWLVRVPEGIPSGSQRVSTVCEQVHRCPVFQDTADARRGACWVVRSAGWWAPPVTAWSFLHSLRFSSSHSVACPSFSHGTYFCLLLCCYFRADILELKEAMFSLSLSLYFLFLYRKKRQPKNIVISLGRLKVTSHMSRFESLSVYHCSDVCSHFQKVPCHT